MKTSAKSWISEDMMSRTVATFDTSLSKHLHLGYFELGCVALCVKHTSDFEDNMSES